MAMVSSSLGPINSLLNKLPTEFTDLRRCLKGIHQHMLELCAPRVVTSTLIQQWLVQLCELAYDIEDWIDKLLIRSGGWRQLEKLSSNDYNLLKEFMEQIADAQERGKVFGLLTVDFADLVCSKVTMDQEDNPPGKLLLDDGMLCGKRPQGIGLDGRGSVIVKHMTDNERELKVVSILGPGGLGKTTLAREVFQKLQNQFDCRALVHVGWNPSINAILMDVAHQVMPKSLIPCYPHDKKLITTKLWEFLGTKKYLIVIDDIWSIWAWSVITCAFPDNHLGSRILATTEMEDVANSCCVKPIDFIFLLKPLANFESELLMLSQMSFLDKDCSIDPMILQSLLKVCGGIPLAIVVAAGLLATKGAVLESKNALLLMMNQDSASQRMRKILEMSYADLSLHLRSCFLYLSAFPENCTIRKDRLIRRWIAEGFIPVRNGESSWRVGESYFKELARRGLIQLVHSDELVHSDDQIGCTIHSVIHEFIQSLSTEENFVTVGEHLKSGSYPCDTIRRFTLDCSKQVEPGILASSNVDLSRVRSLAVSGNTNKQMSNVSAFKLVRVLDLEGATGLGTHQLRGIGSLSLLRYLGLRGSDVLHLPDQVKALEHLETIDLRRTKVKYLPELTTPKLVSLLAEVVQIPRGMGDMLELEELSMVYVDSKSMYLVGRLIAKSKLLRMLGVRFEHRYHQPGLNGLFHAIGELDLETFLFDDHSGLFLDGKIVDFWAHNSQLSKNIKKFELNISHYSVPKVPGGIAYLHSLTHLHIKVDKVEAQGLHVLEDLPNLVLLHLCSLDILERHVINSQGCFSCLKVFSLICFYGGMGLQFGPGVMPQLRSFNLVFSAEETELKYGDFGFGIENLIHLEQVSITIKDSSPSSEAAVRLQVSQIPNNPLLELISVSKRSTRRRRHSRRLPDRAPGLGNGVDVGRVAAAADGAM